ncbi:MAG: primosomal protein N' [Ruminiclostridium sp.]|jgi:primosomal protein N' (replication factor Y)|nr:primosomal protein N' [Ruminiclostridium sp.]MCI9466262.1 primosomal protein N' [Ruminiclostridium sp.]
MLTAKLALSAATFAIDRPYTYRVPTELEGRLAPGMRVLAPFGRGNRPSEGLVLSLSQGEDGEKLKVISVLLDQQPVLNGEGLRLALWMRERFFCTVYAAAMVMLPTGLWYGLKEVCALAPGLDREAVEQAVAQDPKGRQVIELLYACGGQAELAQIAALPQMTEPRRVLGRLVQAGLVLRQAQAKRKVGDKTEKVAVLAMEPADAMALVEPRRRSAPMRCQVTELLCGIGSASVKELCYFTGASMQTIKSLEKSGILTLEEREAFRYELPEVGELQPLSPLNEAQQAAYQGLSALLAEGAPKAALLYGVTGSGKTQVYLHLIQQVLEAGRGAMVLVPEIGLTPSLLRLFIAHFGRKVAVLHSCLPTGARYDEWKRIRDGKAQVVIGTRSAVFAPLADIGLIVLDEEQESSYQSESMVRYHAREVAKLRCTQHKALLLLASATPAVESRYAAQEGQYRLFTLPQRFNAHQLPRVLLADMKQELRQGNTGLSQLLREELEENLRRGEQSILFLNRRGNSRMAVCGQCGEAPSCPRCSVHLTYHSANGRLMCHYCGYSQPLPQICPQCSGRYAFVGMGTQKLQEELHSLYPDTELMRMDADTVSATQSHEVLLDRFRKKNIPILLGTQMVAKGLDFPNVTLVGVVDADLSLYSDNYRSAERTFSLLTQVVGRAGRGEKPGRAVIQTWTPDNDVIALAARQDYDSFYQGEQQMRALLRFPPFTDLFRITASGGEESQVLRLCAVLRRSLEPWAQQRRQQGRETEVLGPAPAGVLKVNNRYRYCLMVKCQNDKDARATLAQLLRLAQQDQVNRGLSLFIDVNPMD